MDLKCLTALISAEGQINSLKMLPSTTLLCKMKVELCQCVSQRLNPAVLGTTIIHLLETYWLLRQTNIPMLRNSHAASGLKTSRKRLHKKHRNLSGEKVSISSVLTFYSLETTHYTISNCSDILWSQLIFYGASLLRQNPWFGLF